METDATGMCELLVGLGDVDVLGVDDAGGEFVEVTVQSVLGRRGGVMRRWLRARKPLVPIGGWLRGTWRPMAPISPGR